jgi:bloom syndrome protein
MIALTATANPRVRIDLLRQLSITTCKWFLCSFNRPNLKYIVLPKNGKNTMIEMIELIRKKFPQMSGIVYCFSRKECESTASSLHQSGIKAAAYHAGMTDKVREGTQKDWVADRVKVVSVNIKPFVNFHNYFLTFFLDLCYNCIRNG